MKPKPLMVVISSHEIPPLVLAELTRYEVRQLNRRFHSVNATIEAIELLCPDRAPLVIAATLPRDWMPLFIRACRTKWTLPGVTIIRIAMRGDMWLGYFMRRTLRKDGSVHEQQWRPQGSPEDLAVQASHQQRINEQNALVARLDEMLGE